MAAKQGLSAQISQASEDAKRAVLSRTTLTNSLWFSNLNTTCTIKSAPPRSPEVLGLLSSKSGWLWKRNEQHVWQARYCCVVPHTFLYYFDAHPSAPNTRPPLTAKQQEELNQAVQHGYGERGEAKQQQPRSSLYHVLGSSAPPAVVEEGGDTTNGASSSTLQPAGIIDLECYTTIHRNSQSKTLMELAGDETVNPDLRSFYFCASDEDESEEWTQAFLSQRHSALLDEKEAYQQVCDGFAQQLQELHMQLDDTEVKAQEKQEELYRVRSQMEDVRRNCWRLVQDTLERPGNDGSIPSTKKAYRTDLETIQAQDLGILAAVQLLCDYTRVLEETCGEEQNKISILEEKLSQKTEVDTSKVNELEEEVKKLKAEMQMQQENYQTQIETLQQKYMQSQKECQDVQKDLASQRMEMTMYQSSTKTKMNELQTHKKILKKEVIELRQKVEEISSELDVKTHKENSSKLEYEQEKQKAKYLERYVEKMESQVKVQQNMMEMMSQAASMAGSVYGGGSVQGGGPGNGDFHIQVPKVGSPQKHPLNDVPASSHRDGSVQDDFDVEHTPVSKPKFSRKASNSQLDDDNKSHMSELTEDRTQRHFDAVMYYQSQAAEQTSKLNARHSGTAPSPKLQRESSSGPPAIIGLEEAEGGDGAKKLDTIMSSHHSSTLSRGNNIPRYGDAGSVTSQGSKKLSVAQRARLEADRASTPVRVKAPQNKDNGTPLRGNSRNTPKEKQNARGDSSHSSGSTPRKNGFLSKLGQRLEAAIDNSVLGVDFPESSDDDSSQSSYSYDRHGDHEEKKSEVMSDVHSEASTNVSIPLAQRQVLQRAQQMQFLKEKGLIKKDSDVKGGAGAASPSPKKGRRGSRRDSDSGSVHSITFPGSGASIAKGQARQNDTPDSSRS